MTSLPAFETTTRLTSPEPTGLEKVFQDQWDERRETQVRSAMSYTTDIALRNFLSNLKIAIDTVAKGEVVSVGHPLAMTTICGSYDRTDRYNKNGDEDKTLKQELETAMRRLGNDPTFLISRYAKKKNVSIIKRGIRTTSTLHYTDGTYDVMDPTKGILVGGEKDLKDIKQIETLYAVLVRTK